MQHTRQDTVRPTKTGGMGSRQTTDRELLLSQHIVQLHPQNASQTVGMFSSLHTVFFVSVNEI